tara:strand:- start:285 stop:704 length:420 start_codon:yes stop_codon:yes gene_type:complete
MNINKIFNKFDKEQYKKVDIPSIEDTPIYWIGMFKKIILYKDEFKERILHFIKEIGLEDKIKDPEGDSKHLAFIRAYYYLNKLSPENPLHADFIKSQSDNNLKKALEQTKLHFENIEEYEKCAHIRKIQIVLKDNLEEY